MMRMVSAHVLFATVLACLLPAAPAQAQAARTFVSAAGSDSNDCITVATACRHFAAAFAATPSGGEIDVLDPANYGSLIITHAVSIQGHGWAAVSPPTATQPALQPAIVITAPSTDAVNLSGLVLDGGHVGNTGIEFQTGASLTIDNTVVRNMTNAGMDFILNGSTTVTLAVSDSYFNDNGSYGIDIGPSGLSTDTGVITASIDRTEFSGNGGDGLLVTGLDGRGTITVAVTDSVAVHNGLVGFHVDSPAGYPVSKLSLTHSLAAGNVTGIEANEANATLWLAQSTVTGNGTGYNASLGGTIFSYGDNYFAANGGNTGILSSVSKQ
jgi:hypothetical protein